MTVCPSCLRALVRHFKLAHEKHIDDTLQQKTNENLWQTFSSSKFVFDASHCLRVVAMFAGIFYVATGNTASSARLSVSLSYTFFPYRYDFNTFLHDRAGAGCKIVELGTKFVDRNKEKKNSRKNDSKSSRNERMQIVFSPCSLSHRQMYSVTLYYICVREISK